MSKYLKKHAPGIVVFTFFIFVKVIFLNRMSFLKGRLIDVAIGKIPMGLGEVVFFFVIALGIYLISTYLLGITRYAVKMNITKDLQDDFFASLLLRNRVDVRKLDVSKAVSSYTAEITLINQRYLTTGGKLLEDITAIVITIVTIAFINPMMAFVTLLVYVLPIFFTKTQQNKLSEAQKSFQAENDSHTDSFLQKLKGIEAIKNYHIEEKIENLFNKSLNKLVDKDINRAETRAMTTGMSSVLAYGSQGIIASFSIYLVFKGKISAGDFVSIFALSSAISSRIFWLARSIESVLSSVPAVKSVIEYINVPDKVNASAHTESFKDKNLALQIKDLCFSYGERKILNELNLNVKQGEKVLILGASGTGKSSLMSLITGFLKPDNGKIYMRNKNQAEHITMVEQEPFIFRGTLEDNLLYDDTNDEDVAKLLNELGLSTLKQNCKNVDERGRNLSGGERKRLALARGFLKDTEILILDEPLANIDAENIENIEKLILSIKSRTVILISHQVSDYLYNAVDTVYELKEGKLVQLKAGAF